MFWILIPIAAFIVASEARVEGQCLCEPYRKCEEKFKPAASFGTCMSRCKQGLGGEIPKEYSLCLSQFDHVLTKTLKCAYEEVGTGCTNSGGNVLTKRNFTLFEKIFLDDFEEVAEKVGVHRKFINRSAENMSRCMLSCFYPAENICTRSLKCGLFMPSELRLMDNLSRCALKNDVSKGIMMEIATCLRSVTKSAEEEAGDGNEKILRQKDDETH